MARYRFILPLIPIFVSPEAPSPPPALKFLLGDHPLAVPKP
jgi:hypothetical protein